MAKQQIKPTETQENQNNPTVLVGSIVFYSDYKKYFNYLSGDEIKTLMNLVFDYIESYSSQSQEKPKKPMGFDEATSMTKMVFEFITDQFKRDKAKYAQKSAINRENGKRGGRPKKNQEKPKNRTVLDETEQNRIKPTDNPQKPNKSLNDKGYRINDNVKEKENIPPQETSRNNPSAGARREEDYPTLAEVESFVAFRNSPVDPKKFYETYANATPPWTDKNGVPIRDWRKVLVAWEKQYRTVYVDDDKESQKELPLGSVSTVL